MSPWTYYWLSVLVLAGAAVPGRPRQLVWVLSVRRLERKLGQRALRRRSGRASATGRGSSRPSSAWSSRRCSTTRFSTCRPMVRSMDDRVTRVLKLVAVVAGDRFRRLGGLRQVLRQRRAGRHGLSSPATERSRTAPTRAPRPLSRRLSPRTRSPSCAARARAEPASAGAARRGACDLRRGDRARSRSSAADLRQPRHPARHHGPARGGARRLHARARARPGGREGPHWLTRFLRNQPEAPPTIADRARYLRAELAKPEAERVLRMPEIDAQQRPYQQ